MTTTELNLIAPLEMSLPPPPKGEVLTDSQWTTLLAIADAIIPCLQSPSQASHGDVVLDAATYSTTLDRLKRQVKHGDANQVAGGFLSEYPSAVPEFRDVMHRLLGESLREESLKGIKVILSALKFVPSSLLGHDLKLTNLVLELAASPLQVQQSHSTSSLSQRETKSSKAGHNHTYRLYEQQRGRLQVWQFPNGLGLVPRLVKCWASHERPFTEGQVKASISNLYNYPLVLSPRPSIQMSSLSAVDAVPGYVQRIWRKQATRS